MASQFTENPLHFDETKEIQDQLKITIPKQVKIRDHIVWKPILSDKIQVFFRNSQEPDQPFESEFQDNRKINRDVIEQEHDLIEFIWKERTLPEGENSCLPVLYGEVQLIPRWSDDKGIIQQYEYQITELSPVAYEIIQERKQQESERPERNTQEPKRLHANNHLILKMFDAANRAERNYNEYQYPEYTKSEKTNNEIDIKRNKWFNDGIYEDSKRLQQIFSQFPKVDQEDFADYQEITDKLMKLKLGKHTPHTKSEKLALFYELVLIATAPMPNRVNYVRDETESPDFGKLAEKDGMK